MEKPPKEPSQSPAPTIDSVSRAHEHEIQLAHQWPKVKLNKCEFFSANNSRQKDKEAFCSLGLLPSHVQQHALLEPARRHIGEFTQLLLHHKPSLGYLAHFHIPRGLRCWAVALCAPERAIRSQAHDTSEPFAFHLRHYWMRIATNIRGFRVLLGAGHSICAPSSPVAQ